MSKALRAPAAPTVSPIRAEDEALIAELRARRLTYLSASKLAAAANTLRRIEDAALDGILVEAGCALGGSSILISSVKSLERRFEIYDVFDMIPPPGDEDTPDVHERYQVIASGESKGLGEDLYYGYQKNLEQVVRDNLSGFGIAPHTHNTQLVKGLVQDTLAPQGPVAFAHVDVDWYDPVMHCLRTLWPNLVVGGTIILDDYHDWGGCRKATDEFLATVDGQFTLDDAARSLSVTRTRAPR